MSVDGIDFPAARFYLDPRVAQSYDDARQDIVTRYETWFIRRRIRARRGGGRALDVPCGTGRFLPALMEGSALTCGVDISPAMLEVAGGRVGGDARGGLGAGGVGFSASRARLRLLRADARALPFHDGTFDFTLCIRLLGHTPPPIRRRILRELVRVTRGELLLLAYVRTPPIRLRKGLWTRLGRGIDDSHWHPYPSRRAMTRDLSRCGLRVLSVMPLWRGVLEANVVRAGPEGGGVGE